MIMPTLKQTLSYLILGQKGGKKRTQIIKMLSDRPYNLHQLAEKLEVNYRTVQHHVDVLSKNGLVSSSKAGGSGEVYFLSPEMESNMELFHGIVKKQSDFTSSPGFFQNVIEQCNDSIVIIDDKTEVYFWNKAAEEKFGYGDEEILGNSIQLFNKENELNDLITKVSNGESIESFETKFKHKTGSLIDVSLTMDDIKDENKDLIGFVIMIRDITEQKRAEEEIKEKGEKYRSVLVSCCPETVDDAIEKEKETEKESDSEDQSGCGCNSENG
jgi:PAS domain S-box-containing protein